MSLAISNLHVWVESKKILRGVTLTIRPGEIHALMGPNGSGKSSLAYAVMGHPHYKAKGTIHLDGKDIHLKPTEKRAIAGLFFALQSPIAIAGVSVFQLLKASHQEIFGTSLSIDSMKKYAQKLHFDESFLRRGIHDGFSGGEKKKAEILQALVLRPKYAIFDEIDTGLDVDALKIVASAVGELAKQKTGVLIITHYQRILRYMKPDYVHVLAHGTIVDSGKASLADKIEKEGYHAYRSI